MKMAKKKRLAEPDAKCGTRDRFLARVPIFAGSKQIVTIS
jgi:hypothetical protein